MMIKKLTLLSVALFSTSIYGDGNLCYEYPPDSYQLINTKSITVTDPRTHKIDNRDLTTKLDSHRYRLILASPRAASRLHPHYFFLLDRESGKVIDFQTSECPSSSPKPKRLYCYGECDSGIYTVENDGRINFKTDGITIGESVDAPEGTWEVKAAGDADLPKPSAVTCPVRIASMDLDPNRDNQAHIENQIKSLVKPIHYVCYRSKKRADQNHKPLYRGCRFTRDRCDNYYPGWRQFGHYGTEEEAMQAYDRCLLSAPRTVK
ncbi:MAG TPA: hypothetical protein ENK71_01035 [Epsilonproteobacteria bacterium]|nr:hypothetical protein [Campylobacterota bacterium]